MEREAMEREAMESEAMAWTHLEGYFFEILIVRDDASQTGDGRHEAEAAEELRLEPQLIRLRGHARRQTRRM